MGLRFHGFREALHPWLHASAPTGATKQKKHTTNFYDVHPVALMSVGQFDVQFAVVPLVGFDAAVA